MHATGAARGNTRPAPFGAPRGPKDRIFILAAIGREIWRTVAGREITRARWQCVATLDAGAADEAITAAVPEWAEESSIVHSSALTPDTITRYEREATQWQTHRT